MKTEIVTDINVLRQKSEPINLSVARRAGKNTLKTVIKYLEDSLDLKKGIGLTAIQIGIKLRIAIIRLPNLKLNLWNPKIIEKTHPFRFLGEHCLSLPGLSIDTKRYDRIVLENGNRKQYILTGTEAIVCQHEIAHMNGRTILDDKWRKRK